MVASQFTLVPFTPEHALLCRYNGLNAPGQTSAWGLAGAARIDGRKAAQLAAATNAAAELPDLGAVNCPMDDSSSTDVYYWEDAHRIRVRYLTSGCETANNGGAISFSINRSDIVSLLERATFGNESATIRGTLLQFGGPVAADGSQPMPRPLVGIVALYRSSASQSTSEPPVRAIRTTASGTFSTTAEPGRYFLVADALDGSPLTQPQPVTLVPGGTSNVALRVDVP